MIRRPVRNVHTVEFPGFCSCLNCQVHYTIWLSEDPEFKAEYERLMELHVREKRPEMPPRPISTGKKYHPQAAKVFTGEVYLTINPPNNLTFAKFKEFVEGLFSYDIYDDYLYAFEVTTKTERCPHVHIVMRLKEEKDVSRKAFRDSINKGKIKWIKEYIDIKNPIHWCELNIAPGTYETTKNYVIKKEVATSKEANDVLTVKWRLDNKIKSFYTKQQSTDTRGGD